ncbi:hypothetical protein JK232_02795 [Nissabacter archeti]|uniref:Uncharacterized protein n=1 Tax=Nissabacter archeti TaxID=1917880 RepID=A0ABS5JCY7_9GAMM|nr:hypothetical protein [Nissabacter archeti]MBS0967813.1 hypothetical protein [Nissabacter archeti]
MRILLFLIIYYPSFIFAKHIECINQLEAASLVKRLSNESISSDILKEMAIENLQESFDQYSYLRSNNLIIARSNEVVFGWGGGKNFNMPSEYSKEFPEEGICVWEITFSLPEYVRRMCDDDGAYGYFFNFRKEDGVMKLNSIVDIIDELPNGEVACKKMSDYLKINGEK